MRTELGKFLKKLRIDNGQVLKDMSERLGVSAAFLSSVENGLRNVPEKMTNNLIASYELSNLQISELKTAIENSASQIKLNIAGMDKSRAETAVLFARKFEEMSPEKLDQIREILSNGGVDG